MRPPALRISLLAAGALLLGLAAPAAAQPELGPALRIAPPDGANANDRFGAGVAVDGGLAVVWAPRRGRLLAYRWDGAAWAASDTARVGVVFPDARIGRRLALRGGRLVIAVSDQSADVLDRDGAGWRRSGALTPDPDDPDRRIRSVAVDGDRVVLGTASGAPDQYGAAFVFEADGGAWARTARLDNPDRSPDFGDDVAIDGDVVAVADRFRTSAVVFERGESGWAEAARFGPFGDGWRAPVALGPGRLVVGLPRTEAADAAVFERGPGGWAEAARLVPTGPGRGAEDVALDGDLAAVGAPGDDALALYALAGGAWSLAQEARPGRGDVGEAIALSEGRFVLGAPGTRVGPLRAAGRVWFGRAGSDALRAVDQGPGRRDERLGAGVAVRGEAVAATGEASVSVFEIEGTGAWRTALRVWQEGAPGIALGDGFAVRTGAGAELARTAVGWADGSPFPQADAVALDGDRALVGSAEGASGSVALYRRGPGGWSRVEAVGDASEAQFGYALALAGDRALVASRARNPDGSFGRVHVFERAADGWERVAVLAPGGKGVFGTTVALAGGEIVVGDPVFSGGSDRTAVAHLYDAGSRARTGFLREPPPRGLFGAALAAAAGLVVVGAPADAGGAAYVFDRATGAWSEPAVLLSPTAEDGGEFGAAVATDGRRVVVGAPGEARASGAVHVFEVVRRTPAEPAPRGAAEWLGPPRPNPATRAVALPVELDRGGAVRVVVLDVLGRRVAEARRTLPAGASELAVRLGALAPGRYAVRATLPDGATATRPLTVVR